MVPWLLGWSYGELDPELRKGFEVALHAGGGLALAGVLQQELQSLLAMSRARAASMIALALGPSALGGYLFEGPIEARLGTPRSVALALIAGGVVMAWADRDPGHRRWEEAGARDALWLGFAQASALFPGVSRGGATLAVARLRGFMRADAHQLSRQMALPVIVGAATLKAARLRAVGLPPGLRVPFFGGAATAFASTVASKRLLRLSGGQRPLAPLCLYRIALGTSVLVRLWSTATVPRSGPRDRQQ